MLFSSALSKSFRCSIFSPTFDTGHLLNCSHSITQPTERKEVAPFAETWIDLENVVQSEISQKEKQMPNITFMWNLEKCCRYPYLQSRNRGIDVENKCVDAKRGSGGGPNREGADMCTQCMCSLSRVRLCDPVDCSPQTPLSTEFSRQEHWRG